MLQSQPSRRTSSTCERLHRDHQLATIELPGLSEPEVRALVDRTTAQPAPPDAVSALHSQTGGNPFFVCEVLAALGDDGVHDLAGDLPLTAGVQSVLAQRLDHLSPDDQAVLAAAATLGADFDLASCAACAEVDDTTALGALERAAAMALVEESGPGSFAFSHALVQAAVMNRTPRTRRARLEVRAAALDAARTMAEPGALGRRVASRLLADAAPMATSARPLDERDPRLASSRATLLRIAAGVSPLMSSPGVEEVVASSLTDERAGRTVLRWARSMILRGDAGLALARALETGELARQLPSAPLLVEAALVGAEAAGLLAGRVSPPAGADVRRLLSDALKALDRDASAEAGVQHAQLLVHLAIASDDQANRGLLSVAARAAATKAGSRRWEAEALLAARSALWGPGSAAERVARVGEAVALAEMFGDEELLGRALAALARDQIAANTVADAVTTLDRLLALPNLRADAIGRARLQQASLALLAGDSAAAGETIEWAAAGGHARSAVNPFDPLATLLLVHAVHQGQLADARSSLFDAAERWPTSLLWIGARAAAESDAGAGHLALAILEDARPLFERGPSSCGDVAGMTLMLRAAAAERHPGERALRRQLQRHGSELAVAGEVGVLGLVDDLLAAGTPA